jgi:hypothetical protein
MWFEQTVWVWLPFLCAGGAWTVWRIFEMRRELRSLRERLSHLEADQTSNRRAAG